MNTKTLLLLGGGLLLLAPAYSSSFPSPEGGADASDVLALEKLIKGKVTDKKGAAVPYAIVAELVESRSNNMVETDSTGCFEITVDTLSTSLAVSAVGYLPRQLSLSGLRDGEVLEICLDVNPDFKLGEVVVTAKRQAVSLTPTGLIYNMDENPLKDDNALEALRFVPMIMINQDELPDVAGRGVPVVYVNGRQLKFSGQMLASFLKSLPAKDIESVEIVRYPVARYSGAGNVLSITLKKKEYEGVRGFLNGGASMRNKVMSENVGLSLDYTKNKWSSFFSARWNENRYESDDIYETQYLRENYTLNRTDANSSKGMYGNVNFIGLYRFSDRRSLGINAGANFSGNDADDTGLSVYSHTNQRIASLSERDGNAQSVVANLNYQSLSKDKKKMFSVDVDYLYSNYEQEIANEMNNVDEQGSILSSYLKERQNVPQKSNVYSAKVEYRGETDNRFSYDFWARAYYSYIRTNDQYWNWNGNDYVFDNQIGSNYKIKEFVPSFYFFFSKWWEDKFGVILATRLEYTNYKGEESRQSTSYETDYFRVLPNLSLIYTISPRSNISYSLNYSLSRPSFYDLNPYRQRNSPTEYSVGNPYLQPTKIFFTEIDYTFCTNYGLYLQYQLMDDIRTTIQNDVGNGMVENKPENIGKRHYVGAGFWGNLTYMNKRGSLNVRANYAWFDMSGSTEVGGLDYRRHLTSASFNNSFLLFPKQNIRFNLYGDYHTKEKNGYTETPASLGGTASLRAGIKNFTVGLYASWIGYFGDGKFSGTRRFVMENDLLQTFYYQPDQNFQIGINFSYTFGNQKVKQVNKNRKGSNEEVKDRVGKSFQ